MNLFLPGHELVERLRYSPEQRRSVWRANVDGQPCVTRILHVPVDPALEVVIRRAALEGRGRLSGLHRDLESVLQGYQVLATLGDLAGAPEVMAAGLGLDAADPAVGYPYVSVGWADGETLDALFARGAPASVVEQALLALLRLLGQLSARGVAHGDVKPSNFVLSPSGELHLIDPDTLRHVPADPGFVRVHDRTPGWASPEQLEAEPRLTLASDLYSFGLMVCQGLTGLRPGQPGFSLDRLPPRWRPVVDACLRPDALARPRAERLLEALASPGAALLEDLPPVEPTTRVPEPQVASTPSAPPPALVAAPPPARPRRSGLRLVLGSALGLSLVVSGGAGTWALVRRHDADLAATEVWRDLRVYKTQWRENTDKNLDAIVESADKAVLLWPTPEALGLQALVRVWDQRWHYVASARPWDAEDFAASDAVVSAALEAGPTLGALAARGVLDAGACRKMPVEDGIARHRRCEEAIDTLSRAEAMAAPEPWLALELAWNRVMALAALAQISDAARAAELRRQGLRVCQAARTHLSDAPVNNWYIASDCLELAGATDDVNEFIAWADWLQDTVPTRSGQDRDVSQARVARQITQATHPDCGKLAVRRDGLPDLSVSACEGDRTDLCRALALAALGCSSPLWRGCLDPQEDLPWDAVDAGIRAPLREKCPGTYDMRDLPPAAVRGLWQSWPGLLFSPE